MEQEIINRITYDPETGYLTWKPRGRQNFDNRFAGKDCTRLDKEGYKVIQVSISGKVSILSAHRIAWFLYYGEWPLGNIDHVDRNNTNNKIGNLRIASQSQNSQNRKCRTDSLSGYKGVRKTKRGTYRVKICKEGNYIYKDGFSTAEEAALEYNELAKELHGDFAVLNQIN